MSQNPLVRKQNAKILLREVSLKSLARNGDWHISLSFGKSRSENFEKALYLAKKAPRYEEGNAFFQATYGKAPKEYLEFVRLYEMVAKWKSSQVVICGEFIDRKIVGALNYCYGDKCRSGNPDFCYGASVMTENPFGCHRLQVSSCNHPWWTFGMTDTAGNWLVDKEAILQRMRGFFFTYRFCPSFDAEKILEMVRGLPEKITKKTHPEWEFRDDSVSPPEQGLGVRISLNIEVAPQEKQQFGIIDAIRKLFS